MTEEANDMGTPVPSAAPPRPVVVATIKITAYSDGTVSIEHPPEEESCMRLLWAAMRAIGSALDRAATRIISPGGPPPPRV
jgi:hypothetical protein